MQRQADNWVWGQPGLHSVSSDQPGLHSKTVIGQKQQQQNNDIAQYYTYMKYFLYLFPNIKYSMFWEIHFILIFYKYLPNIAKHRRSKMIYFFFF